MSTNSTVACTTLRLALITASGIDPVVGHLGHAHGGLGGRERVGGHRAPTRPSGR